MRHSGMDRTDNTDKSNAAGHGMHEFDSVHTARRPCLDSQLSNIH